MSESNELDDATQLSDRTVLSDKTVLSSGNTAQSAEATTNAAAPSTVKNSAGENAAEKNDTAEGNAEKSTVARSISSASGDGTEVSDETVLSDGTVISETPHARGGAAVGEADKSKGAPTVAIPTLPKRRGGAAAGKAIRGKKSAQAKPSQAKSVQNKSAQSPVQNKTNGEAVSPVSDTGDNTTNNGPGQDRRRSRCDAAELHTAPDHRTRGQDSERRLSQSQNREHSRGGSRAPSDREPGRREHQPADPGQRRRHRLLQAGVRRAARERLHRRGRQGTSDPGLWPDRPARRWPCPARRQPRHRQDSAGTRHRELDQRVVQAHPVHARPAAVRRGRHHLLRPEARRVRVPRGPGIRVHRARRRNQPSLAEDPSPHCWRSWRNRKSPWTASHTTCRSRSS